MARRRIFAPLSITLALLLTIAGLMVFPAQAALTYEQTILLDGPFIYYRYGEPSGTNANDAAFQSADTGTIVSGVTLGVTGLPSYDTNTAFRRTSAGNFVTRASVPMSVSHSIEGWIKPETSNNGDFFDLLTWAGTNPASVTFRVLGGSWRIYTIINAGVWVAYLPNTFVSSTFHHVVHVYDNQLQKGYLYLDGSLLFVVPAAAGMSGTANMTFGYVTGATVQASYDEFAYYQYALSATQILNHYNAGIGTINPATPTGTLTPSLTFTPSATFTRTPNVSAFSTLASGQAASFQYSATGGDVAIILLLLILVAMGSFGILVTLRKR